MTHLRIDMSENDSSHIDMVADSVGSDTCHYSWVVRVTTKLLKHLTLTKVSKTLFDYSLLLQHPQIHL